MSARSEEEIVQLAVSAVANCNWTVGQCASEWTEKYAKGRSDEDFGRFIDMSGDQVCQRRLTWDRFGETYRQYKGLKWSHFYVARTWDDADDCLEWAVEMGASVSEMRAWRRASRGEDLTQPESAEASVDDIGYAPFYESAREDTQEGQGNGGFGESGTTRNRLTRVNELDGSNSDRCTESARVPARGNGNGTHLDQRAEPDRPRESAQRPLAGTPSSSPAPSLSLFGAGEQDNAELSAADLIAQINKLAAIAAEKLNHDDRAKVAEALKSAAETVAPTKAIGRTEINVVAEEWNMIAGVTKVAKVSDSRSKAIKQRLSDPYWREHWREAMQKVAESDFCKGNSDSGWVATFDWFIRKDTLLQIMEGKYDNRDPVRPRRNASVAEYNEAAFDFVFGKKHG